MQGILYEEPSAWLFVLVTVCLGGWAALMTGRAMAQGWQPIWTVVGYGVLLGAAVRFLHFALFSGTLLSLHFFLVDVAVVLAIGLLGFRVRRVRQMTSQYRWLYEKAGPFTWREKVRA